MTVNEKYAHTPEPIIWARYLIQDIKIEEILGATETWNSDGDYELPNINSGTYAPPYHMILRNSWKLM